MTDAWGRPAGSADSAAGSRPGPRARVPEQASGHPSERRTPSGRGPSGIAPSGSGTSGSGPRGRRPGGRRPGDRGPERQGTAHHRPGAVAALVLILPPLAAALISGGTGVVFWAGSLLGAVGAAALCSRPGVWWVATGTPPVVLLMALAGLVLSDASAATSKLGTDLAKVVAGAFPAMGGALLCAVAVGAGRTLSARGAKGNGRG